MSDELEKRVSKLEDRHEELQMQFLSLSTQVAEVKPIVARIEAYYQEMAPRIRGIESSISSIRVERTQCYHECTRSVDNTQHKLLANINKIETEIRKDIEKIAPIVNALKFFVVFVVLGILTAILSLDIEKLTSLAMGFLG